MMMNFCTSKGSSELEGVAMRFFVVNGKEVDVGVDATPTATSQTISPDLNIPNSN